MGLLQFDFQTPKEREKLRCFFSTSDSSWLLLGPMKIQLNSLDPYHVTIKNIMYEHECDGIIAALGSKLRPWHGNKALMMKTAQEWEDIRVMKKYTCC